MALHSNAAPENLKGQLSGPDIYYFEDSVDGKEIINYFDDVAPNNKMGYFSIQGRYDATQIMGE